MRESKILPNTWPALKAELTEGALPADHQYELLARIDNFKQGSQTVEEYSNQMIVYCAEYKPDMSEKEIVYYIWKNLNPRLQIQLTGLVGKL